MMPPVTLLLYDSNDLISARIVEILADWRACSWLGDYATLSMAELEGKPQNTADLIAREPPTRTSQERFVRVRDLIDGVELRIAVLTAVDVEETWIDRRSRVQRSAQRVKDGLSGIRAAIEVIVPFIGGAWSHRLQRWPGWDIVVCAPEESSSLERQGLELHCDVHSPRSVDELAAHAAAFTAGIAGLWAGNPESPFDDTDQQDDLHIGRVEHRRIDGTVIADLVRSTAFDEEMLRVASAEMALSDNPLRERAAYVAGQINLLSKPARRHPPQLENVGFWESLKLFVSFMFSALIHAPREVAIRLTYQARQGTANRLQSIIFGENSKMLVSVGGVSADIEALQDELDELEVQLKKVPGVQDFATTTSGSQNAFWQACLDNAFALLTGGRHGGADPVIQEGSPRFYPSSKVAPPLARWKPDGQLVSGIPTGGVPLEDVRAVFAAKVAMEAHQADQHGWGEHVDEHLATLHEAAVPWLNSYIGRVGGLINTELTKYGRIVADLKEKFETQTTPDTGAAESIVRDARRFGGILTVLVLAGVVLAWAARYLNADFPALLVTIAFLMVWFVAMAVRYLKTKQKLLHIQYERELAEFRDKELFDQFPVAVENASRLVRLYSQYRLWASLLSTFLQSPFGNSERRDLQRAGLTGAVPKSVTSGAYAIGDERMVRSARVQIAESLRCDIGSVWRDFIGTARETLVEAHPHLQRVSSDDVLAQSDTQPGSFLPLLWDAVHENAGDGARMSEDIAFALDQRQMDRVLRTVDPEALESLREACKVQRLGSGGRASSRRLRQEDLRPALFNASYFSLNGIQEDVRRPDHITVFPSVAMRGLPTRHWFDEIDTAIVMSPSTTFAAVTLSTDATDYHSDVDSPADSEPRGM